MKIVSLMVAAAMLIVGCRTTGGARLGKDKFERLFSWNLPNNEEGFERCVQAGVTDIIVHNTTQFELATKHGMRAYWKCFLPDGPYWQVMNEEETKHYDFINGKDLDPKMPREERSQIINQRRIDKNHRFGGEMVAEIDTINSMRIKCFISDDDFSYSQKRLDAILKDAPDGVCGIFMDYNGYMNHNGCYCENCLRKYRDFLADQQLEDSKETRKDFYLGQLIDYYNKVIDYVKKQRPDYKVVIHVYPDFKSEPLLGNRTKADYCGQTVAWYFKWHDDKIRKYTKYVIEHAKDYHKNAEGIPFLGISTDKKSPLAQKTPEDVEREMKQILKAGGRTLMICDGRAIIAPGFFEVFKKYSGKKSNLQ
jgi:hypothetical protein